MKTFLLYRPNSEHERQVLDYVRDFKMQTGKDLPTLDADSREGIRVCELYDIVQYPAILATDDTGRMQQMWVSDALPRASELSYYVQ